MVLTAEEAYTYIHGDAKITSWYRHQTQSSYPDMERERDLAIQSIFAQIQ